MKRKTTIARNYKILHEASNTLASLRDGTELRNEMLINQIQVHLVDEGGDGIVLCLEYADEMVDGELNKTFHSMEEYYASGDCLNNIIIQTIPTSIVLLHAVKGFIQLSIHHLICVL
jgi:hypothetical protein